MESNLPDLTDKVILLYLAQVTGALTDGTVLEDCRYAKHADRLFVIGTLVRTEEDDWQAGLECGVAWDAVISYVLFPSHSVWQTRFKE